MAALTGSEEILKKAVKRHLGRNIGFVPAQREIVTVGAYRYMRHPIYTGLILRFLAVALRIYGPTQCSAVGNRRFLDDRQKLRGGEFPPRRPAIRRIHDDRTGTLDPLRHLKSAQSARFASFSPVNQVH